MHRHLVAIKVGVKCETHQRVELNGASVYQHGLEGLDAEAVERRSAVEQHGTLLDHLVEHVPDLGTCPLGEPFRAFDVVRQSPSDQGMHDKRLEQFKRHALRQPALVQLQVRTDDDHRPAGVVDALAQQVLAEASLLALEHIGERLQLVVARSGYRPSAPAVVDQGVDRLLKHALLIADDDLGGAKLE